MVVLGVIYYYNSRDRAFVIFSIFAFINIITFFPSSVNETIYYPSSYISPFFVFAVGLVFTATKFFLAFSLLDNKGKILHRLWLYLIPLIFVNEQLFRLLGVGSADNGASVASNVSQYSITLLMAITWFKCFSENRENWLYYTLCFIFLFLPDAYYLALRVFPPLRSNYLYLLVNLWILIIGLSTIIVKYSIFLTAVRKGQPGLYRPNRKVSQQIIQAQEQERDRIARDLHDQLGSILATIKLQVQQQLEGNAALSGTVSLIDKASTDVRDIAYNLMPAEFQATSLNEVVDSLLQKVNQGSQIHFSFYRGEAPGSMPKELELTVYRIISELVTNIVKHSKASEASVQLLYYEKELEVLVEDNGNGFRNNSGSGMGLKNIRSRVKYLKGKIYIDSNKRGTTVVIKVPYA
jgi:signal transduction histidine kinase